MKFCCLKWEAPNLKKEGSRWPGLIIKASEEEHKAKHSMARITMRLRCSILWAIAFRIKLMSFFKADIKTYKWYFPHAETENVKPINTSVKQMSTGTWLNSVASVDSTAARHVRITAKISVAYMYNILCTVFDGLLHTETTEVSHSAIILLISIIFWHLTQLFGSRTTIN